MESNFVENNKKIEDIWQYAIPLKDYPNIGTIEYLGYNALVIVNQFERIQKGVSVKYHKGWINLTKLQADFEVKNPGIECKLIRNWGRTDANKQAINRVISRCTDLSTVKQAYDGWDTNKIDIQGTYFHPSIVLDVLKDTNSALKKIMDSIVNDVILNRNKQLKEESNDNLTKFLEELHTIQDDLQRTEMIKQRISKLNERFMKSVDMLKGREIFQEIGQLNEKLLLEERHLREEAEKATLQERQAKEQKENELLQVQKREAESKMKLEELRKKQSKFTGSIYKETIDIQKIKEHCLKYENPSNSEEIKKFFTYLDTWAEKFYCGQGSDPDPYFRPSCHQKGRKALYLQTKDEPKYCQQINDYIQIVEKLPENIPQFDLDIFMKAEILQQGIEINQKDLNPNLPIHLRKTKLTEAEQQWFKICSQKSKLTWNTIKFDGSMTVEQYDQKIAEENKIQDSIKQDINKLNEQVIKLDAEILRLKRIGETTKADKKQLLQQKTIASINKKKIRITTSEEKSKQFKQNRDMTLEIYRQVNMNRSSSTLQETQKSEELIFLCKQCKNDQSQTRYKTFQELTEHIQQSHTIVEQEETKSQSTNKRFNSTMRKTTDNNFNLSNQNTQQIDRDNLKTRLKRKPDEIINADIYCDSCGKQFTHLKRFQTHMDNHIQQQKTTAINMQGVSKHNVKNNQTTLNFVQNK